MATSTQIQIDSSGDAVTIQELTIHDDELLAFLEDFEEEERESAIERALLVGATTLEFAGTSKDLEFVKSEFRTLQQAFEDEIESFEDELEEVHDELEEKLGDEGRLSKSLNDHFGEDGTLERHIETAFGKDGAFVERLDEELGEDGERIKEALDPGTDGTPTNRLQNRLIEEIRDVKKEIVAEEGRDEIREESWHSGDDFEDKIAILLDEILRQTPNSFEDTSEDVGEVTGSKKGDFVITLDDTDQRIVLEAKNGNFDGTPEDEMETAIENRNADYGILVAKSIEYLPRTRVGWFSEIDQNFVTVALSDEDDDEIEPRFLKFAFHWARTRAILNSVTSGEELDTDMMRAELEGIEGSIEDFSDIRTKCTNIENSTASIRETLDETEEEIMESLGSVRKELTG
jgi:gas vesicle protein